MVGLKIQPVARETPVRSWWPSGAGFAADFIGNRYMRAGSHVSQATALTFTRPSAGWATDSNGKVHAFAANEMRRTTEGLQLEGARSRLSLAPLALGSAHWTSQGATIQAVLPADGSFPTPCRIASDGTAYARRVSAPMSLTAGNTVRIKIRYHAGTSSRFGLYMQTGATTSLMEGPVGYLTPNTTTAGSWANVANLVLSDGSHEIETDFTPAITAANWQLGVSPRSNIAGEYVDVPGAMVASGSGVTEWIFGEPATPYIRATETLTLHLPAGAENVTLSFTSAGTQAFPASGNWVLLPSMVAGKLVRSATAT